MRFIYLSRHFNIIGYYILKNLLEKSRFKPCAVILPTLNQSNTSSKEDHYKEINFFHCESLKFFKDIEQLAIRHKIPSFKIDSIKTDAAYKLLQSLQPDLIVLGGGWPELLPEHLINMPRLGVINTHPSLLPKFRGTDVHRWQIYKNVQKSGATIHYVDKGFDTGPIIGQVVININSYDIPQKLHKKVALAARDLMVEVLEKIKKSNAEDKVSVQIQTARDDLSLYYSAWCWDDEFMQMNWNRSANDIHRYILACTQESFKYNGPFFFIKNNKIILRQAEVINFNKQCKLGTIMKIVESGFIVKCMGKRDNLLIKVLQIGTQLGFPQQPNCEPSINAHQFLELYNLREGSIL